MELGGFEPPTSWVRYTRSIYVPEARSRILERHGTCLLPVSEAGYAPIYTRICGDSGTKRD
jgi:hypothetical protein